MHIKLFQKIIDIIRGKATFKQYEIENILKKHYSEEDVLSFTSFCTAIKKGNFVPVNVKDNIVKFTDNKISFLVNIFYPWIALEIFLEKIYEFHDDIIDKNTDRKYTIIDMGANNGYTSLYFAAQNWVKNIFSYELFPQTAQFCKKSVETNTAEIADKIKIYPFGLGGGDYA